MARQLFYEVVLKVTTDDGDTAPATDPMPLYPVPAGGSQYTDVQPVTGGGTVTGDNRVTPDAAGRLIFTAADGFTSNLWAEDAAGKRYLIRPALDSLVGPKGDKGDTGGAGSQGLPGQPGPAGSLWLSGTVAPVGALGKVTDWYVNTTTGDYYEKTATATWTQRGSFGTGAGSGGGAAVVDNGNGILTITPGSGSTGSSVVDNGNGILTLS